MYFGTIAHMHVKPGMAEQFMAYGEQRGQEDPDASVAMIVFQSTDDPNLFYLVVVAESEESYRAVAEDPKTHEQYLQMIQYLDSEPIWHDGYVVHSQFPQTARR